MVGGNSSASTPGSAVGQYPVAETPPRGCDGNLTSKYLNFGSCTSTSSVSITCGLNTGFYVELQRGSSLVIGLRLCTGNDAPERDPFTISLEGSNLSGSALVMGNSWTLIYNGTSGLQTDPGRNTCGVPQLVNSTSYYKSYRFLVSSKRSAENSMQFGELQLYGY